MHRFEYYKDIIKIWFYPPELPDKMWCTPKSLFIGDQWCFHQG